MSEGDSPNSEGNATLAYLKSIDRRLAQLETRDKKVMEAVNLRLSRLETSVLERNKTVDAKLSEISEGVEKQSRYLFIGRIAFATAAIIAGIFWWMLEHSSFLSGLYFHFIEKGISHDHTQHSE